MNENMMNSVAVQPQPMIQQPQQTIQQVQQPMIQQQIQEPQLQTTTSQGISQDLQPVENKMMSEPTKTGSLDKAMVDLAEKANAEYKEQHPNSGINIDEISSLEDFNSFEILNNMREKDSNYTDSLTEEDKLDMAHVIAKQNYDYFTKERKNFSEEANQIMEKIKRGHIPDDKEFKTMMHEEQWLKENSDIMDRVDKLNELKQRVSGGKIDTRDFDELLSMVGFDDEMSNLLRQEFSSKGILIENYENVNQVESKSR